MEKIWIYAIVGGFAPAIFWLLFWIKQDLHEPEPKKLILKTLLFGSAAAFFAVWLETMSSNFLIAGSDLQIFLYSFIEEFAKFSAVFLAALGSVWNNEREDPMLYMIIGALGFAAIENIYYIIDYISNGLYLESLINSSYRFIGATLLHIATSAIVGAFISLVFFKSKKLRIFMSIIGLFVATFIHYFFNILITHPEDFYQNLAFYGAWLAIVLILIIFELFNQQEKYRIIKNDMIYSFYKKNNRYQDKEEELSIFLEKKEKVNFKKVKYNDYKNESFRKKFF